MRQVDVVKYRSMRFVRKMFQDRNYLTENMQTFYDEAQDLWQITTSTKEGHNVVAVFAECASPEELTMYDGVVQEAKSSLVIPTGNKKKTGTDYIKCIFNFAKDNNFKVVILVTDVMTPQASKLMLKSKDFRLTHFKYDETGIEHMADHITQPVKFYALKDIERDEFVAANPRYKVELQRYSFDDALVKYYGMVIGDIIHIIDNDRQSGMVSEFGIVVEEIM